jgi:hypothetical protein
MTDFPYEDQVQWRFKRTCDGNCNRNTSTRQRVHNDVLSFVLCENVGKSDAGIGAIGKHGVPHTQPER